MMIGSDGLLMRCMSRNSQSTPLLNQGIRRDSPREVTRETSRESDIETEATASLDSAVDLGSDDGVCLRRGVESEPSHRESFKNAHGHIRKFSWSEKTRRNNYEKTLTVVAQEEIYQQLKERDERRQREQQARRRVEPPPISPQAAAFTFLHSVAHHSVAESLAEILKLCQFDMRFPAQSCLTLLPWMYRKVEKDVYILTRRSLENDTVCVAGVGFIRHPVDAVWNIVSNMENRCKFDRTTSKLDMISKIDADNELWHLELQIRRCFLTQKRDFVLLTTRRIIDQRRLICNKSVNTSKCPLQPYVRRGNIKLSSYQVEPYRLRNQIGTRIIYVLHAQVANIPQKILDLVSMRQPMTIAYIRMMLDQKQFS